MILERSLIAAKAAVVERHLERVAQKLPDRADALVAMSDASDAVILHLWQATQIVIDLAVSACVRLGLDAPATYADAFRRLAEAKIIDPELAQRLTRAAGFRNVVAHAYEGLDLERVHGAAVHGPRDLRAFLAALRDATAV